MRTGVCSVIRVKSEGIAGMLAGSLHDAPCTNIRSEASTPSPRPFFSSDSSLSGYASAATGSPGQDVNDPEAGRQHNQSRGPDQGCSPGTHKEGIGGARLSGEVFPSCCHLSLCLL